MTLITACCIEMVDGIDEQGATILPQVCAARLKQASKRAGYRGGGWNSIILDALLNVMGFTYLLAYEIDESISLLL
jgi:hypothetical protein